MPTVALISMALTLAFPLVLHEVQERVRTQSPS
jgi:hypothetical protein